MLPPSCGEHWRDASGTRQIAFMCHSAFFRTLRPPIYLIRATPAGTAKDSQGNPPASTVRARLGFSGEGPIRKSQFLENS
jgi:hypothetical protein